MEKIGYSKKLILLWLFSLFIVLFFSLSLRLSLSSLSSSRRVFQQLKRENIICGDFPLSDDARHRSPIFSFRFFYIKPNFISDFAPPFPLLPSPPLLLLFHLLSPPFPLPLPSPLPPTTSPHHLAVSFT